MTSTIFHGYNKKIQGKIKVPGDKSISHRAVLLGSIAEGKTKIDGFLMGDDCLHTMQIMRQLGVRIEKDGESLIIEGNGIDGLSEPADVLDVGNSGTAMRLLIGLLSARPFYSVLVGDASIHQRPMDRVVLPLKEMGANITGRADNRLAPITVNGRKLHGIEYDSPVSSAQVKSAILLAGLQTEGTTIVREPELSRDHTERMIRAFGGSVTTEGMVHTIVGPQKLTGTHIKVPGDISSAAFFIAAALITPGSHLIIENVGVNPTRTGILDILQAMGADVALENERLVNDEPVSDIVVRHSSLKGAEIGGEVIPRLIDEIPILALIATQAEGQTVIRDASELKVKETNRIVTVVSQLRKMGADIEETDDGMIINGQPGKPLKGGNVNSFGDHRIGMMLAIASQAAKEPVKVDHAESIAVSFPGFETLLESVR
ncbi:3-phosphoshikimate 1-carboxyvinyltransferase [Scopulibacillus daqui]|uniref:3-phosphoshikimate 1-carboxyvinyltransferase n=1 Tax=Scopulibacillus daqui TaxID=1469162 RepID=A0ABS2PZ17_9BACL|nr:3-phosphoshikimate 1-carboxyvinyltransferase [Scopulibacillus daqui]MBM7645282.1 3-phosphoshikimate 1-carboxyvinyltransferase [Scopulibacillus daqui]